MQIDVQRYTSLQSSIYYLKIKRTENTRAQKFLLSSGSDISLWVRCRSGHLIQVVLCVYAYDFVSSLSYGNSCFQLQSA